MYFAYRLGEIFSMNGFHYFFAEKHLARKHAKRCTSAQN